MAEQSLAEVRRERKEEDLELGRVSDESRLIVNAQYPYFRNYDVLAEEKAVDAIKRVEITNPLAVPVVDEECVAIISQVGAKIVDAVDELVEAHSDNRRYRMMAFAVKIYHELVMLMRGGLKFLGDLNINGGEEILGQFLSSRQIKEWGFGTQDFLFLMELGRIGAEKEKAVKLEDFQIDGLDERLRFIRDVFQEASNMIVRNDSTGLFQDIKFLYSFDGLGNVCLKIRIKNDGNDNCEIVLPDGQPLAF